MPEFTLEQYSCGGRCWPSEVLTRKFGCQCFHRGKSCVRLAAVWASSARMAADRLGGTLTGESRGPVTVQGRFDNAVKHGFLAGPDTAEIVMGAAFPHGEPTGATHPLLVAMASEAGMTAEALAAKADALRQDWQGARRELERLLAPNPAYGHELVLTSVREIDMTRNGKNGKDAK